MALFLGQKFVRPAMISKKIDKLKKQFMLESVP